MWGCCVWLQQDDEQDDDDDEEQDACADVHLVDHPTSVEAQHHAGEREAHERRPEVNPGNEREGAAEGEEDEGDYLGCGHAAFLSSWERINSDLI
jgi:hypothetical protein